MSTINVMIGGVGGQGTVLASKLLAAAAMEASLNVRTTETIGMAQRGGSVVSHVRMGAEVYSPLIPLKSAQLLLALEPAEGVRLTPYLAPGGLLIVCDRAIKPVTASLSGSAYNGADMTAWLTENRVNAVILDGEALVQSAGVKALNVALLGAAAESGKLPFPAEALESIICTKVPAKFREMNMTAFSAGKELYHDCKPA